MSAGPESVVRTFLESWSNGDADEMAPFFADDADFIDSSRGRHQGKEAIRSELTIQAAGVNDVVVDLVAIACTGRTVLTERRDRFTLAGHPFVIAVAGIFELDDGDLITAWRDYYDVQQFLDEVAAAGVDISTIPEPSAD